MKNELHAFINTVQDMYPDVMNYVSLEDISNLMQSKREKVFEAIRQSNMIPNEVA